jgi:hypothetical protein
MKNSSKTLLAAGLMAGGAIGMSHNSLIYCKSAAKPVGSGTSTPLKKRSKSPFS